MPQPPNMQQMMKQVQQMQADMAKAQEELKSLVVEASAGGGTVTVKVTGDLEVVEVKQTTELERRIPPRHELWALDERGRQLSSQELADGLARAMRSGRPGMAFLVGGADGLPAPLVARADVRWSLGRLTLPHRLARLILVEQLYRAVSE